MIDMAPPPQMPAVTLEDKTDKVQNFATEFRTRTGHMPDARAALSADAARILFSAANRAKGFKADKLREQLKPESEFDCLTGKFWFTSEQTARRTVYILHLQDGTPKLAKTYAPEKK